MIIEYIDKVKRFLRENRNDLYIAAIIFLVGLASFGLGRLSVLWPQKAPLVIEESDKELPGATSAQIKPEIANLAAIVSSQGKYVASKNGTAYHFPWCSGAQKIKEENKIWFQTREEAESRGYKPAGNCEGL